VDWPNKLIVEFAESANPSGTESGWHIRKQGSKYLQGDPERQKCSKKKGFVHIMLDA
jgi:hypothetical protein